MLIVKCSEENYIYDIHSLVKAFYPGEDVKVYEDGTKELSSSCDKPELFIRYFDDRIEITLSENEKFITRVESVKTDKNDRVKYKNALKTLIYNVLSMYCGKVLPWGTLTGIRPTKIAVGMLQNGATDDEVMQTYVDIYKTSERKSKLSVDIAHRELDILSGIHYEKGYSLYIGIAFCPTTCLYCSFTSFPRKLYEKRIGEYINCIKKEIDYVADNFNDKILDSIYIGGGTPTTLESEELRELLSYIYKKLDTSKLKEFTVEAGRADSITREKLEVLKEFGVGRISINPQTFKPETLDLIGRRHTVEQVFDAYKLAREVGFDNINMDLIVGLPGENYDDVAHTLEVVKSLAPESVTVHSLAVKRASKLGEWIEKNDISMINNTDEIMQHTENVCRSMGLNPYYLYRQKNMSGNFENVGYAQNGKEGIYNILIMEEVQTIIACGAGTVTKRVYGDGRIERCDNVKDVALYISKIEEMIDRKRQLFKD